MKRTIHTTNEFVYDVLNNMIHHNEIILSKKDLENSRSLKNIVGRFANIFETEDAPDHIILRKTHKLDVNIKYRKKF